MNNSGATTTAIGLILAAVALIGVFFIYRMTQHAPNEVSQTEHIATPTPLPEPTFTPTPTLTPTPMPTSSATPTFQSPTPSVSAEKSPTVDEGKMVIPVVGIKAGELTDTYTASRSEGRTHNALDIMARGGTPVVATADGEIARFHDSDKGGITIYQLSSDKTLVYYYAHLERRADGLQEKQFVKKGTLLGYVGDTGNSGKGNYHLHFAVWRVQDPKRIWEGENINPFDLLKNAPESSLK